MLDPKTGTQKWSDNLCAFCKGPHFQFTKTKQWDTISSNLILRTIILLSGALNVKEEFKILIPLSRHRGFLPSSTSIHMKGVLCFDVLSANFYWMLLCARHCTQSPSHGLSWIITSGNEKSKAPNGCPGNPQLPSEPRNVGPQRQSSSLWPHLAFHTTPAILSKFCLTVKAQFCLGHPLWPAHRYSNLSPCSLPPLAVTICRFW